MADPREIARRVEQGVHLPSGVQERFSGYGLIGLPFTSGHILGLRYFPASSLGTGYTSVWHRDPRSGWSIYQDTSPHLACPRYFGSSLIRAVHVDEIRVVWPGSHELSVTIPGDPHLDWHISLTTTPATWLMNSMAKVLPDPLWRNASVLQLMSTLGSVMLGAGRIGLSGRTPNGQKFMAAPRRIWRVADSIAIIEGRNMGPAGPLPLQEKLGDFWIPQRGIFAVGSAMFEGYDPVQHVLKVSMDLSA